MALLVLSYQLEHPSKSPYLIFIFVSVSPSWILLLLYEYKEVDGNGLL